MNILRREGDTGLWPLAGGEARDTCVVDFPAFAVCTETAENSPVAGRKVPILAKVPILREQLGTVCLPSFSGRRHTGPYAALEIRAAVPAAAKREGSSELGDLRKV
jgi:hypothetical protein